MESKFSVTTYFTNMLERELTVEELAFCEKVNKLWPNIDSIKNSEEDVEPQAHDFQEALLALYQNNDIDVSDTVLAADPDVQRVMNAPVSERIVPEGKLAELDD